MNKTLTIDGFESRLKELSNTFKQHTFERHIENSIDEMRGRRYRKEQRDDWIDKYVVISKFSRIPGIDVENVWYTLRQYIKSHSMDVVDVLNNRYGVNGRISIIMNIPEEDGITGLCFDGAKFSCSNRMAVVFDVANGAEHFDIVSAYPVSTQDEKSRLRSGTAVSIEDKVDMMFDIKDIVKWEERRSVDREFDAKAFEIIDPFDFIEAYSSRGVRDRETLHNDDLER